MNKAQKLVQFWGVLAVLIKGEELTDDQAKVLVDLRQEIDCGIPKEEFTVECVRALHQGYHSDKSEGFDDLVDLVEVGFQDLAPYLRIPRARLAFSQLQELIDPEGKDLFVRQIKTKRLDTDPDGFAIVLVAVSDYRRFKALLHQRQGAPENIHYSDGAA